MSICVPMINRLETPTVVWNSECRHMLGVVLRELEGATPGLQDVPAIEVHQVRSFKYLFRRLVLPLSCYAMLPRPSLSLLFCG